MTGKEHTSMSVVMIMRWDGVSLDQYEQARSLVGWENETPDGALFHIAAHDGQAMRVTDLWESAEQFQTFAEQRLMPGVAELGLPGQPQIEIYPVHATFAPGYTPAS
jgi:hypothetical protein